MELLCVLAAVAALFCGCTVLTLKCRVPASVAPLTALSLIVAVLTLAAMAGVLYPITWAVYALCLAGGVWVLATRKNHAGAAQKLFTPGSVLFWGMALAFTVYFFVRQPMATDFDELSLWATAVKITKVNNDLYATAELGTPWAATQNPGLPLLAYFFQFLGDYADWKIYVGYDILYFSVFAAVVGAIPREQMACGRADGRRAVVRAVLLHELQPHYLPDHHLHDQLRRCTRGPCVRRGRGRVAGAAPKFGPQMGRAADSGAVCQHQGQYVCIGAGGSGAGGCGRVAVCRRRRFQGRSAPPHRVQPGLFCRTDGNLLSVECALCGLAGQPQRQRFRRRRDERPAVCGRGQRHQDPAGPVRSRAFTPSARPSSALRWPTWATSSGPATAS